MSLLSKIFGKPKETVVSCSLVLEEVRTDGTVVRPVTNWIKLHLGYDKDGMPMTESFIAGVYDVIARNAKGESRQFRFYGRPLEIGSEI
ncbi:hypothetical protein HZA97_05940 [Candidatus Woesearchaeota archaeon]|nr:hypothetical protein [Candidatus Woesearchaeota archaeon]